MAELEVNQPQDQGAPPPSVPLNETPVDGPGSGRSELRKQLEKNVDTARKSEETDRRPRAQTTQRSRARQEMEAEGVQQPAEGEPQEGEQQESQYKAPEGWTKEAKAEWANLTPTIQAAVAKRETDMAKGVEDLKARYSEIDTALQPRMDVIRRHGHTPAQAVNQLFAWFEALSANPHLAFPALAQSFKFDLRSIPGLIQQMQGQQGAQQAQPGQQPGQQQKPTQPEDIPLGVQNYVRGLEQKLAAMEQNFSSQFGQLTNSFQAQTQAKTEEILSNWSKDKPYFEDVRRMMAHLIASQAVQPLPNGAADLDRAYDMALWALPDVRTKVLADQQTTADNARKAKADAEKSAQQVQADKARRANAGSLVQGAPGAPLPPQKGKSKGKSVRESLMEAREELGS